MATAALAPPDYQFSSVGQWTNPTSMVANPDPWSQFFGEPVNKPQQSADRDLYRTHDDLPAYYEGKNYYLADVLEGLVSLDNGWPTSAMLPLTFVAFGLIKWNEFKFDQHLVDTVPHEGVSRIVEHGKTTKSAQTLRRGLACFFEHDFMTTPDGIRDYTRTLMQIKLCVQLTNSFDALYAVLTSHDDGKMWEEVHGYRYLSAPDKIDAEIRQFAMIHKDDEGIYKMDAQYSALAAKNGFKPNMYIFPPGLKEHIKAATTPTPPYLWVGPNNVSQMVAGPEAMGSLQGVPIFETPAFDVFDRNDNLSVLDKFVQTGDYMTMFDTWTPGAGKEYVSESRDIWAFDETKDDDVRIRFRDMFMKCGRFTDTGALKPIPDGITEDMFYMAAAADRTVSKFSDMVIDAIFIAKFNRAVKNRTSPLTDVTYVTVAATATVAATTAPIRTWADFAGRRVTRQNFELLIDNDLPCPCGFILFRPWMTHVMGTVILMRGGPETGHTFWSHSNFMLSQDGILKTIYGNFTYYSRAIVHKAKNIILIDNVFYRGYRGGANCMPIKFSASSLEQSSFYSRLVHNHFMVDQQDYHRERESMFVFMVPYHQDASHLRKAIDITGDFYRTDADPMPDEDQPKYHYETAPFYQYATGLASINPQPRGVMHQLKVPGVNTICVQGYQKGYTGDSTWEDYTTNKGHHGPWVYPTCGRVRNGETKWYHQVSYVKTVK